MGRCWLVRLWKCIHLKLIPSSPIEQEDRFKVIFRVSVYTYISTQ